MFTATLEVTAKPSICNGFFLYWSRSRKDRTILSLGPGGHWLALRGKSGNPWHSQKKPLELALMLPLVLPLSPHPPPFLSSLSPSILYLTPLRPSYNSLQRLGSLEWEHMSASRLLSYAPRCGKRVVAGWESVREVYEEIKYLSLKISK